MEIIFLKGGGGVWNNNNLGNSKAIILLERSFLFLVIIYSILRIQTLPYLFYSISDFYWWLFQVLPLSTSHSGSDPFLSCQMQPLTLSILSRFC